MNGRPFFFVNSSFFLSAMPIRPHALNSTLELPAAGMAKTVTINLEANVLRTFIYVSDLLEDHLEDATDHLNAAIHARAHWLETEQNRALNVALSYAPDVKAASDALDDAKANFAAYARALWDFVHSDQAWDGQARLALEAGWLVSKQTLADRTVAYAHACERLEDVTRYINSGNAEANAAFDSCINARLQQALRAAAAINALEADDPPEPSAMDLLAPVAPYGPGVIAEEADESETEAVFIGACEPTGMQQDANLNANHQPF